MRLIRNSIQTLIEKGNLDQPNQHLNRFFYGYNHNVRLPKSKKHNHNVNQSNNFSSRKIM